MTESKSNGKNERFWRQTDAGNYVISAEALGSFHLPDGVEVDHIAAEVSRIVNTDVSYYRERDSVMFNQTIDRQSRLDTTDAMKAAWQQDRLENTSQLDEQSPRSDERDWAGFISDIYLQIIDDSIGITA